MSTQHGAVIDINLDHSCLQTDYSKPMITVIEIILHIILKFFLSDAKAILTVEEYFHERIELVYYQASD